MKLTILSIILSICFGNILLANQQIQQATIIDKMVVFGDSLSDVGKDYHATQLLHHLDKKIPIAPASPYSKGRFSNGQVWDQYLANFLHLSQSKDQYLNYSFGGAWATKPHNPTSEKSMNFIPDIKEQLTAYIGYTHLHPFTNRSHHLYIIWIGANDYLSGNKQVAEDTAAVTRRISYVIHTLIKLGGKQFLVLNMPALNKTPLGLQHHTLAKNLSKLSIRNNVDLRAELQAIQLTHPDIKIIRMNVFKHLNAIIQHPAKFGFTNATVECNHNGFSLKNKASVFSENPSLAVTLDSKKTNLCSSTLTGQNKYVFWDFIHPTTHAHCLVAKYSCNALSSHGISCDSPSIQQCIALADGRQPNPHVAA